MHTTNTLLAGIIVATPSFPAVLLSVRFDDNNTNFSLKSPGVNHNKSPLNHSAFPVDGVEPVFNEHIFLILLISHSAGMSPIHSMPLSFIGLSPRMPLVTACVMTACFSFLYSSMDARVFSNTVSISAHCASKNVTMRFCSASEGTQVFIAPKSLSVSELRRFFDRCTKTLSSSIALKR